MRKKLDSRIRILVENAVNNRHRAFFVMVGDRGKDQVVNLHYMLSKLTTTNPSVLWCYKDELGFSSHKKKRQKQLKRKIYNGLFDPSIDDPFELFVTSTPIRYCYYKETHLILGQTFSICVLQDFEALSPNILCRTIETVEGGGIVCLLLRTMNSLRQLYTLTMDLHSRFSSIGATCRGDQLKPRFNERFILSLADCRNCLVVDDELNILPISKFSAEIEPSTGVPKVVTVPNKKPQDPLKTFSLLGDSGEPGLVELKRSKEKDLPLGHLIKLAVTLDQAKVLLSFVESITQKGLNSTLTLTAARGRGKSATLGLAVAAALAYSYSNVFITAPAPENVGTLFEFIQKGLLAIGYIQHKDFELVQGEVVAYDGSTSNHLVRINVFREHRQTVQYITPDDIAFARQSEILVIDEAAAIPLPTVKKLFGPYLVFLSSTISGYEGTGRALSLKLIKDLKADNSTGRQLQELQLETPIRYAKGDALEAWLNKLLCLDCCDIAPQLNIANLPPPFSCQLYQVDRDALFSYHGVSESLLKKIMGLFVASHYKNSPNDLFLLSDAPAHQIFILTPPLDDAAVNMPDILVAIQVAFEGAISRDAIKASLQKGTRPSGDLIPWTLSQTFIDEDFGSLTGARIVRIAVQPMLQRMGYGSEALRQLIKFFDHACVDITNNDKSDVLLEEVNEVEKRNENTSNEASTLLSEIPVSRQCPALLSPCHSSVPSVAVDYIGTCFGVTSELFKFHARLGFFPAYIRHSENETTGEHSIIMIRPSDLSESAKFFSIGSFVEDFRNRTLNLLDSTFKNIPVSLGLSLVTTMPKTDPNYKNQPPPAAAAFPSLDMTTLLHFFTRHDLLRIERYTQQRLDRHLILDLIPTLARLIFTNRIPDLELTSLQNAVILGIGAQKKSIEIIAKEFSLPISQVLALFNKAMHRVHSRFNNFLEEEAEIKSESHQPLELPVELPEKSLNEELQDTTKQKFLTNKTLQVYSTEKIDEDINSILKGKLPARDMTSIRSIIR